MYLMQQCLLKHAGFTAPGLAIAFTLFLASLAEAQPTNIELFQRLAVECVSEISMPETVALDADESPDYLRSAVTSYLIGQNVKVYAVSADFDSLSRLHMRYGHARVQYERKRGQISRSADVTLHFLLTRPDNRITGDSTCHRSFDDTVDRRALPALEDDAYPESKGRRPEASWRRRYLEPVIMAGATAVTVLLFFSLRSKRAGSE